MKERKKGRRRVKEYEDIQRKEKTHVREKKKRRKKRAKDGLIDFNGMSTYIELFYAYSFRNCIHCMFILIFFV